MKIRSVELNLKKLKSDLFFYTKPINKGIEQNRTSSFTLLQMYEILGIEVPQLCYCNELFILGVCRMCGVYKKNISKIVMACAEEFNKMTGTIWVEGAAVTRHRKRIMHLHLTTHPLDCPICDQASECDLQELSFFAGRWKSTKYTSSEINQHSVASFVCNGIVKATMIRCILCSRCVTWLDTKVVDNQLGFLGRGKKTEISFFTKPVLETSLTSILLNTMSISLVDICPVGAFTVDLDKFTTRLHHSKTTHSFDLFDWTRPSVRVELNANIIRVTPIAIRTDRSLATDTYFPVLSDWSRLLLGDLLEIQLISCFKKNTLFEKETIFMDNFKLHKNMKAFTNTLANVFTSNQSICDITHSFDSISSKYNYLLDSLNITTSNKHQLISFYEQLNTNNLFSVFSLNQPNRFIGNNSFNFYKPTKLNESSFNYYLKLTNYNEWSLAKINNLFTDSNTITSSKKKLLESLINLLSNNPFSFNRLNQSIESNHLYSNLLLYPITLANITNDTIISFSKYNIVSNEKTKELFTTNRLPFFSNIHSSRIMSWFIRNTTSNFIFFLQHKQQRNLLL